MQLTIDIKDSVLDKVLYLLENLKSDIKIIETKTTATDTLSLEQIKELQVISNDYKQGRREEFVEYRVS